MKLQEQTWWLEHWRGWRRALGSALPPGRRYSRRRSPRPGRALDSSSARCAPRPHTPLLLMYQPPTHARGDIRHSCLRPEVEERVERRDCTSSGLGSGTCTSSRELRRGFPRRQHRPHPAPRAKPRPVDAFRATANHPRAGRENPFCQLDTEKGRWEGTSRDEKDGWLLESGGNCVFSVSRADNPLPPPPSGVP